MLTLLAGVELVEDCHTAQETAGSVLTAGVLLEAGTHWDQFWPSVDVLVLTAGVELLAELHTDQFWPGSVDVLVLTTGVEVVADAQFDHTGAGPVLLLVEATGVLLAPSQLPQAVELTDVAITGVGNPDRHVSFRDSTTMFVLHLHIGSPYEMLISILQRGSTTATGAAMEDQPLQFWPSVLGRENDADEVVPRTPVAVLVTVLETTAVLVMVVFVLALLVAAGLEAHADHD